MHPATNPNFRTSSYSDRSDCVEVADLPGSTAVRDTRNRHLDPLSFPSAECRRSSIPSGTRRDG
ncbi:DUF397 domain-containing protein [Nocardiopsis sp. NPDC049922]|uniref:DUF397 domain-containing protein n=1 Tax=Nocardiopsis sp. NPDC049922 TaxID=3155157 RepID=UPI0033FDC593